VGVVWWSDDVIPRWLTAPLVFIGMTIAGAVAAGAALWALTFLEGDGRLFLGWILHPEIVIVAAIACGVVVGLAVASPPSTRARSAARRRPRTTT